MPPRTKLWRPHNNDIIFNACGAKLLDSSFLRLDEQCRGFTNCAVCSQPVEISPLSFCSCSLVRLFASTNCKVIAPCAKLALHAPPAPPTPANIAALGGHIGRQRPQGPSPKFEEYMNILLVLHIRCQTFPPCFPWQ